MAFPSKGSDSYQIQSYSRPLPKTGSGEKIIEN